MLTYTGLTSKYELAQHFAKDSSLQSQVKRLFNYKEYSQDIIQDMLYQILTIKNEDKIISICRKNEFNFWLFSALKKQKYDPDSYTNRFYVNKLESDIIPDNETNDNMFDEQINKDHKDYIIQLIKQELINIGKKNWYQRTVFDEYVRLKEEYRSKGKKLTFEQFGKEKNINHNSLFQILKKVKQKLIDKIKNEL